MSRERSPRLLVAALVFVTLVVAVISSLGAPLIPLISADLGIPLSDAQWALTATLLVGAISAPVMGRIGDGPHRRRALLGGLTIVLAGGVLAALATTLPMLVAGRALQGVGLGLVPLAMASARDSLPLDDVRPAIGLLSVATASGIGVGYPLSGLIAEHVSLHAAFWFGVLFTAIAFAAVLLVVPDTSPEHDAKVDVAGTAILTAGLICLLLAIGEGERWGWGSPQILALLAAAALILPAWCRHQLRCAHPLVDLRLLRHRPVLTANVAATVLGVAMYMNLSVLTEFVQSPRSGGFGFGASVLTAGLCLVPLSVLSFISNKLMPALRRVVGPHGVLPAGCLLVTVSSALFAVEHGALWEIFVVMGILGLGLGWTFTAIPVLIVGAVPHSETGSAMGFYQVVRYIGFSLGSALAAAIVAAHTPAGTHLPEESGYVTAAWIAAAVCAAAAALAWILPDRSPVGETVQAADAAEAA